MKKFICVMLEVMLLTSCKFSFEPSIYGTIHITNNSSDYISPLIDERKYNPEFPSMFDELPNDSIDSYWQGIIRPYEEERIIDIYTPLDEYFNTPDKRLIIYIFSTDTLKKYTWKEIKESKNYLKRYDLWLEDYDMNKGNYRIVYP